MASWNEFALERDGKAVHCALSPCAWMHRGYGVQVQLSFEPRSCNAASVFAHDKAVDIHDMERPGMIAAARTCAQQWLDANGVAPIVAACERWERAQAEFEREDAKRQVKEARRKALADARHKANGYTHKFLACIHPKAGGDDYFVEAYCVGVPNDASIAKLLARSAVKTDYKVTAL